MCSAEDAENAKESQYIGENTEEKRIHALVRWMIFIIICTLV